MGNKRRSSTRYIAPAKLLNSYERLRQQNMEKNKRVLEELGLPPLLKQMNAHKKGQQNRANDQMLEGVDEDQDYIPSEEELEAEDNEHNELDRDRNHKGSNCRANSMADLLRQKQEQLFAQKIQQQSPSQSANGTNMQTVSSAQNEHVLNRDPAIQISQLSIQRSVEEQLSQERGAEVELRRSRRQADMALRAAERRESNDQIESATAAIIVPESQKQKKKHRGPTMLFDVHARTFEERVFVLFNDKSQPIGPSKKVVSEFSQFLGTIARDETWAPLTYVDWRLVPDKDKMWEYVNEKYIIPASARKWVLHSIRECWRVYKSRIKHDYYTPHRNDVYDKRLENRPPTITEETFKILLHYWDNETVQEKSVENAKNREKYEDVHTTGPMSFARKYVELKNQDGQSPSKTKFFEETRKRTDGREYKRKNIDRTLKKIADMKEIEAWQEAGLASDDDEDPFDQVMKEEYPGRLRLQGRGVCLKSLKAMGTDEPTPLAPEFVEAIKVSLGDEMQKDFDAHKQQMEVELQAEKDKVAQLQAALDAQKAEFDAQKVEFKAQKIFLENLQNMLTPEVLAHLSKPST